MSTFHCQPVGAVLVTLVLDQDAELLEDQVDPADRVIVRAHDEIAVRRWQPRKYQTEPQHGLARRVDPAANESGRTTRRHGSATGETRCVRLQSGQAGTGWCVAASHPQ